MNTTKKKTIKARTKYTVSRYVGTFKCGQLEHPIDIPAGTRCIEIMEGSTAGKFFVDDLTWIADNKSFLYHDAYFYGIILSADQVE